MQIPLVSRRGQNKPFPSIPRINWGHPLTKGLVTYLYDCGGGVVIDLATGRIATMALGGSLTTVKTTAFGSAWDHPINDSGVLSGKSFVGIDSVTNAAPYSSATGYVRKANSVTNYGTIYCYVDASTNTPFWMAIDPTSQPTAVVGTGTLHTFAFTNPIGAFATQVVTLDASNFHHYVIDRTNGFNSFSGAASANTFTGLIPAMYLEPNGGIDSGFGGSCFYGATWSQRVITPTEVAALHQDPWQFLIYPEDEIFATLVGAIAAATPVVVGGTAEFYAPKLGPEFRFKPSLAFPAGSQALSIPAAQGTYTLTGNAQTLFNGLATFAEYGAPPLFSPGLGKRFKPSLAFPNVLSMSAASGVYSLTGNAQTLFNGIATFVEYGAPKLFSPGLGKRFNPSLAFPSINQVLSLPAAQGTYTLTGQAQTLFNGLATFAEYGAPKLFSPGLGYRFQPSLAFPPGMQVLSLSAVQGTYALTGQPQTLNVGRSISAVQGIYTLTGEALTLDVGMPAAQGTYTLTGEPQTLNRGIGMSAAQGTYTLSGQAQNLFLGRLISAAQGSYSLTGQSQSFAVALSILPVSGVYSLSGQGVALILTPAGGTPTSHNLPFHVTMGQLKSF